jgi:hypothetical protein
MYVGWVVLALAVGGLAGVPADAATPVLTVTTVVGSGLKAAPAVRLTVAELAALPQSTLTVKIGGKGLVEKGPQLTEVIAKAGLRSSTARDDELDHYWFDATNASGAAVVVASVELAPDGGNRTVVLSMSENGTALTAPRLVVQGDRAGAREITGVTGITIGRVAPQLRSNQPGCNPPGFKPTVTISQAPADIGAVVVNGVVPKQTVTFPQIEAMPAVTQIDAYTGEGETKQHQEHGPTLYNFLVKADPALKSLGQQGLRYYVELTSSEDGSGAVVSWAEIDPSFDGKPFLLSTYEDGNLILDQDTGPRLTTPGDTGGTRYSYGIQAVTVFEAPAS